MNKYLSFCISLILSFFIINIYVLLFGSENNYIYTKFNFDINTIDSDPPDTLIFSQVGINVYDVNTGHYTQKANVPLNPLISKIVSSDIKIDIPIEFGFNKLSKLVDQGDCGSCWIFSTFAMLEDRFYLKTSNVINLSVQQVLECFDPKKGCFGNSPEALLIWLSDNNFKIGLEKEFPYLQKESSNINDNCNILRYGYSIDKNSIKSITKFVNEINPDINILKENIIQMKKELILNGPFWAALTIYDDFFLFTGDGIYDHIYQKNESISGGHAIEIIGYFDDNKIRYWKCRSSWVEDWPSFTKNGEFKIKMGSNNCGIESRCGAASLLFI
jgi:cathepsin B